MGKPFFTWGEIKEAMQEHGIADDAAISINCVVPQEDRDHTFRGNGRVAVGGSITDIEVVRLVVDGVQNVTFYHGNIREVNKTE
jgi:hypothetical protein